MLEKHNCPTIGGKQLKTNFAHRRNDSVGMLVYMNIITHIPFPVSIGFLRRFKIQKSPEESRILYKA